MGVRNAKKEELGRLEAKTLDAQFCTILQQGLNCSPFETQAVLNVVKEVYFPFLEPGGSKAPPGAVSVVAVDADEPAGKAVAECKKRTLCLQVHRGAEDDRLLQAGAATFRQARIAALCQEALSQGGLLTREDLAYRIFFVSVRTISRDLSTLRRQHPPSLVPLRSALHDIGPVLSHRVQIVRLALEGRTTSEICDRLRHSPAAVANYLDTFCRCAQLQRQGMQSGQIAFLLRRGQGLIEQYLQLLQQCSKDKNMTYHLEELLQIGNCKGGKKSMGRGRHEP